MKEAIIINYTKDEGKLIYFKTNAYEFVKCNWLIKVLLKFKIIKQYIDSKIEIKTKIIDKKDIVEQISEIMNKLRLDGNEIEKFIVGRKQIKMLENEYIKHTFICEFRVFKERTCTIYGIPVEINPFIDGIVPILKAN